MVEINLVSQTSLGSPKEVIPTPKKKEGLLGSFTTKHFVCAGLSIAGVAVIYYLTHHYLKYAHYKNLFANGPLIGEKAKNAFGQTDHSILQKNKFNKEVDELVKQLTNNTTEYWQKKQAFSHLKNHMYSGKLSPIGFKQPTLEELIDNAKTDEAGRFRPGYLAMLDPKGKYCFDFKNMFNIEYPFPCPINRSSLD